jgi:prepilin-type N-terminal cleavage/methylation domain-containing protein/prepilin-type processing-associated H-X9-DG protein
MKSSSSPHPPHGEPQKSQTSAQSGLLQPRWTTRGFTLVELLVVILIIVVLAGVTFSITQKVRQSAAKVSDMNNLRNLSAAAMAAGSDNAGRLPQLHAGAKEGNSNSAPYYLFGRVALEAAGIFKESCYAPTRNIYGGAPAYPWWYNYGDASTPTHYCYFAADGSTKSNSWFTKGSVKPPDKNEYHGAIAYEDIIKDATKAFPRSFTDDAWYPILWAGLCRDYAGAPRVAAIMNNGEALGVNVMFLDGHSEWIPKAKMKARYTAGSLKVNW